MHGVSRRVSASGVRLAYICPQIIFEHRGGCWRRRSCPRGHGRGSMANLGGELPPMCGKLCTGARTARRGPIAGAIASKTPQAGTKEQSGPIRERRRSSNDRGIPPGTAHPSCSQVARSGSEVRTALTLVEWVGSTTVSGQAVRRVAAGLCLRERPGHKDRPAAVPPAGVGPVPCRVPTDSAPPRSFEGCRGVGAR